MSYNRIIWAEDECTKHDPDHQTLEMWWQERLGRDFKQDWAEMTKQDLGDAMKGKITIEGNALEVIRAYDGDYVYADHDLSEREQLHWRGITVVSEEEADQFKEWFTRFKNLSGEVAELAYVVQNPIYPDKEYLDHWNGKANKAIFKLSALITEVKITSVNWK